MFRLICRIESAVVDVYEFVRNTWYYLGRRHRFRDAVRMARNTLTK